MAGLSAKTEKIRIGTLVICNSYRNPALLAKTLSTIDHISNGRLEIGYGAGWMEPEYKAYGYEFPSMGTRLKMFEEGLHIMKAMFTEKRATFEGRHYKINEAICNPKPVQKPHPPITIGGSGEKIMLKLVARFADRWNCPAGYGASSTSSTCSSSTAKTSGATEIDVSEQLLVCIGANEAEVEAKWKAAQMLKPFVTRNQGHAEAGNEAAEKARRDGHHDVHDFLQRLRAAADARAVRAEVMPAFA